MVSAWASANHLVLGQTRVNDRSNEITAIPELLGTLDLSGCIVSIDAMGFHQDIAMTITEQGADYVLALKQNQPELHEDVKEKFALERQSGFADVTHDFHEIVEKRHGRIETRRCGVLSDPDYTGCVNEGQQWDRLRSLVMVEAERQVNAGPLSSLASTSPPCPAMQPYC